MNGASDSQTLVITDHRVIVIKVGFRTGQTLGGKVISYPYPNISSVEVRSPILSGVFEISAAGTQGVEKSYWNPGGKGGAWHAPNAIAILKRQVPKFQQAANLIREHARQASGPAAPPAPTQNIPEQIQGLAALRDQGILSADEFEAKKTDLLSRM
jgi:hypothetical protein